MPRTTRTADPDASLRLVEELIRRGMLAPEDDPYLQDRRVVAEEALTPEELAAIEAPAPERYTGMPDAGEVESAEGCIAWITEHCKLVSDVGKGIIPFTLFDYQRDAIRDLFAHRQVIILKARQLGMTELVAAYVMYRLRWPYRTAVLISRGEDAAGEMVNKARVCWNNLPLDQRIPLVDPRHTSRLVLVNGSRILPQPATPGAGRVLNAQILVFDEWAHQANQAAIYAGAAPTASAGDNQIIGLSSANGLGNEYARQWELAQAGMGMHPIFLPWYARPGRDAQWYEDATRGMEDWQKAQEFPATPEEAFILSGRPRFDVLLLKALSQSPEVGGTVMDPIEVIPLGVDHSGRTQGYCRIWERPTRDGVYVCGADVAEGLVRGDYSTAIIMDARRGVEVAELHGHWETDDYAAHLAALCRIYGGVHGAAFLGVERNNHGHAVLLALRSIHNYPVQRLYHHQEYNDIAHKEMPRAGWLTSGTSKPLMIDALAVAIKERRPYRNALFIAEALRYIIKDNGDTSASGKADDPHAAHDDRVVAYAICEMMRRTIPTMTVTADLRAAIGEPDPYGNQPVTQVGHPDVDPSARYTAPQRQGDPLGADIYGDDMPFFQTWGLR